MTIRMCHAMCFTWVTRGIVSLSTLQTREVEREARGACPQTTVRTGRTRLSARSDAKPLATQPVRHRKAGRGYPDLEPSESRSETRSAKVSGDLPVLNISYDGIKWGHTIFDLP